MSDKLKQIKNENIVWIIYIIISVFAIISNYYEKKYYLHHNKNDKDISHSINMILLTIGLIIYIYFVSLDINNKHKNKYQYYHEFAAVLFVIAGIIYLYVEYKNSSEDEFAIF